MPFEQTIRRLINEEQHRMATPANRLVLQSRLFRTEVALIVAADALRLASARFPDPLVAQALELVVAANQD